MKFQLKIILLSDTCNHLIEDHFVITLCEYGTSLPFSLPLVVVQIPSLSNAAGGGGPVRGWPKILASLGVLIALPRCASKHLFSSTSKYGT